MPNFLDFIRQYNQFKQMLSKSNANPTELLSQELKKRNLNPSQLQELMRQVEIYSKILNGRF